MKELQYLKMHTTAYEVQLFFVFVFLQLGFINSVLCTASEPDMLLFTSAEIRATSIK